MGNILYFHTDIKNFDQVIDRVENTPNKTIGYIRLLKWLRKREWEMDDSVPLKQWFEIRNQIIEIEKRLKKLLKGEKK